MAARRPPASAGAARQPRNPISRRQIETVASRSVAVFGLVFGAQTAPVVMSQFGQVIEPWGYLMAAAVYGGLVANLIASLLKRGVRAANIYLSVAFLVSMGSWPFFAVDPFAVASERPWLWFLVTVATAAAAIALRTWAATLYLFAAPIAYGLVRVTPSGGAASWGAAALDTSYAIILGGAVLIIITTLRQAAASVDTAQSTALDRYAHAVRQHATEVERVQVDAIVHDSVLTTLLSAARAYTPESKELATRMARNAIGHLRDAAAVSPDDDAMVSLNQLAHRVIGATATLSAPFELRTRDIDSGAIPVQAAEAVYSAAVQAMVNSLQHAGGSDEVRRWLAIHGVADGGIEVVVGDDGAGFALEGVPMERLGLRVSIMERVANAGGTVEIDSSVGRGTAVSIRWPSVQTAAPAADAVAGTASVGQAALGQAAR